MGSLSKLFSMLLLSQSVVFAIAQQAKPDSQIRAAVVDSLSEALSKYYVYPEKAAILDSFLNKQAAAGNYDTLSNPNAFAYAMVKDIRKLVKDQHLVVRYDPQLEKRIVEFNKAPSTIKSDVTADLKKNFFFKKAEILPGNIGYIVFTNFADTGIIARRTVNAALRFVAYSDALIIDLRNNFGGSGAMSEELLSYFFREKTFAGRRYNRLTDSWQDEYLQQRGAEDELVLSMPVYLLTSERTYSAAEGFAYHLQQLKNARVVGDTTRGAAHLTRSFALGNGFVAFIPYSRMEHAITKKDWEGTGVLPDIPTREAEALHRAQELALRVRLAEEKDSVQIRRINWLLNDLAATSSNLTISGATLKQYTGRFEEFLFEMKGNALYYTNTHQVNSTTKMKAIKPNLFKVDAQLQVEFIKETGTVTAVKLYWDDGWVDYVRRTK
jgi:hypothetical protein